jgi:lysophospholipase L1-like esterase
VKPIPTWLALGLLVAVLALRVHAEQYGGISPWLFLSAITTIGLLLVELALRAVATSAATRARVRLLAGTTFLMLFAVEAALRYGTLRWATYTERNGGVYGSLFEGEPTWFHTFQPDTTVRNQKAEFLHVRTINSLGFPDREFTTAKTHDEYRMLALGDSFTEGVGTSAETTWVKVAEARLAERYPARRITSLNAGVSGSDPYFEYMLLKEKLQAFHPDLVIVAINSSDLNEAIARGGSERFRPDGTVAYSTRPGWDRLYGLSYIWRAIVHEVLGYNTLFVKSHDAPARNREAARLIALALDSIRDFCRDHGINLLVVSHPQQGDVELGRYGWSEYDDLMRRLERDPDLQFVDLLKYYTQHGLMTKEMASELYWPLDYHHKTKGYRIMGEAIAANIVERGFVQPGPEVSP